MCPEEMLGSGGGVVGRKMPAGDLWTMAPAGVCPWDKGKMRHHFLLYELGLYLSLRGLPAGGVWGGGRGGVVCGLMFYQSFLLYSGIRPANNMECAVMRLGSVA